MPTLPLFAVENCYEGKLVGVKERAVRYHTHSLVAGFGRSFLGTCDGHHRIHDIHRIVAVEEAPSVS